MNEKQFRRQMLLEAIADRNKYNSFTFERERSLAPNLKEKFDREMLIDSMVELANRYAFRFPEATNELFALAVKLKEPLPPAR